MSRCKLWKGCLTPDGYPRKLYKGNPNTRYHRVIYADKCGLTLEAIKGIHVLHTCDKTRCINEDHLIGGTHTDNMLDRARKERNPNQKISAAQALEIYDLCTNTDQSNVVIATRYKLDPRTVSSIRHRKHFKWLLGG